MVIFTSVTWMKVSPPAVTAMHNSTNPVGTVIFTTVAWLVILPSASVCSNCSAQFYKFYVPGYFYFSQLSYIVSVL